jgi:hypothetical protein
MPHSAPLLVCRSLQAPRRGASLEECEDAVAAVAERGRFAVADGASESAHAGLWARLLVEDFTGAAADAWTDALPPLQRRWAEKADPRPGDTPLPWYLEDRLRQGAFATFLGLVVDAAPESNGTGAGPWRWRALAIGDSCLFQVRARKLLRRFPVEHSAEFTSSPWLVGSRTPPQGLNRTEGDGQPGDRLWLMTDALALWFLRQVETGLEPWLELELMLDFSAERFAEWVEGRRKARELRDDDVTLLAVILESA